MIFHFQIHLIFGRIFNLAISHIIFILDITLYISLPEMIDSKGFIPVVSFFSSSNHLYSYFEAQYYVNIILTCTSLFQKLYI